MVWALCFAACAAVSLNALSFNASTVMNTLLQPLVAIVLLWVMLRLPIHLARVAMLGAMPLGAGVVSRAVSYAAGSQIRDTAKAHLPPRLGRGPQPPARSPSLAGRERQPAADHCDARRCRGDWWCDSLGGRRFARHRSGVRDFHRGGRQCAGWRAASGRSYTPPPTAQANTVGQPLQNGLQTPSFSGREQDFQNETFAAQYRQRTDPVSAAQATAALQSLPESTQRGVGQLVSDHGAGAREHLAYQAMGEWSPQQREALRTLAAATPEVRQQAISDILASDATTSAAGAIPLAAGDERSGEAFSDPTSLPAQPPPGDQPPTIADHSQTQTPASPPRPPSPHSPPNGESS